jgi:hypothetical protein
VAYRTQAVGRALKQLFELARKMRDLEGQRIIATALREAEGDSLDCLAVEAEYDSMRTDVQTAQAALHQSGMMVGDDRFNSICKDYGFQQRCYLEQQLIDACAALQARKAHYNVAASTDIVNRRGLPQLQNDIKKASSTARDVLQRMLAHDQEVRAVQFGGDGIERDAVRDAGTYDVASFAVSFGTWLASNAVQERQPEWPWAANPAWNRQLQVDPYKQRFFRCQEELHILRREASDMKACVGTALAAARSKLDSQQLEIDSLLRTETVAYSSEAAAAAKSILAARGSAALTSQRVKWLEQRLAGIGKAIDRMRVPASSPMAALTGHGTSAEPKPTLPQATTQPPTVPVARDYAASPAPGTATEPGAGKPPSPPGAHTAQLQDQGSVQPMPTLLQTQHDNSDAPQAASHGLRTRSVTMVPVPLEEGAHTVPPTDTPMQALHHETGSCHFMENSGTGSWSDETTDGEGTFSTDVASD